MATIAAAGSGTWWEQRVLPGLVQQANADVLLAPGYTARGRSRLQAKPTRLLPDRPTWVPFLRAYLTLRRRMPDMKDGMHNDRRPPHP